MDEKEIFHFISLMSVFGFGIDEAIVFIHKVQELIQLFS
jgi:hypothetical protein